MLAADLKARQRSMLERMLENLGAAAPHPSRRRNGLEGVRAVEDVVEVVVVEEAGGPKKSRRS